MLSVNALYIMMTYIISQLSKFFLKFGSSQIVIVAVYRLTSPSSHLSKRSNLLQC